MGATFFARRGIGIYYIPPMKSSQLFPLVSEIRKIVVNKRHGLNLNGDFGGFPVPVMLDCDSSFGSLSTSLFKADKPMNRNMTAKHSTPSPNEEGVVLLPTCRLSHGQAQVQALLNLPSWIGTRYHGAFARGVVLSVMMLAVTIRSEECDYQILEGEIRSHIKGPTLMELYQMTLGTSGVIRSGCIPVLVERHSRVAPRDNPPSCNLNSMQQDAWNRAFTNADGRLLEDLSTLVSTAEALEDAKWPTPKPDDSSGIAMAGWVVLHERFRWIGDKLVEHAESPEVADEIRRDWNHAEEMIHAIESGTNTGGGSLDAAFKVETTSRIAWHYLKTRFSPDSKTSAWMSVKDATGKLDGTSYALTNGLSTVSLPDADGTPCLWLLLIDPAETALSESGATAILREFRSDPIGLQSEDEMMTRVCLDGDGLVPIEAEDDD